MGEFSCQFTSQWSHRDDMLGSVAVCGIGGEIGLVIGHGYVGLQVYVCAPSRSQYW